jgi:signal transduction histidine kinase
MRRELDAWLEAERREQSEVQLQAVADELGRLAAEVVELNGPAARAKSITLGHRAVAPAPAQVDPWRWREVVDNLVSNAIKFSPTGARVTVLTGVTGARAWCRVEDEGPGLTSDDRARIFGAYARLSAQPTAGESSTGLGLFGVKRLVEAHGGEITAENRAPVGAVFTVTVPCAGARVAP